MIYLHTAAHICRKSPVYTMRKNGKRSQAVPEVTSGMTSSMGGSTLWHVCFARAFINACAYGKPLPSALLDAG